MRIETPGFHFFIYATGGQIERDTVSTRCLESLKLAWLKKTGDGS